MRKMFLAVLSIFLILGVVSCGGDKQEPQPVEEEQPVETQKIRAAKIETDFGEIIVKFFEQRAPGHTANFMKLAGDGFYDGRAFHSVVAGFKIETGGQVDYTLKPELSDLKAVRGRVCMSRAIGLDSSGSGFFIFMTKP